MILCQLYLRMCNSIQHLFKHYYPKIYIYIHNSMILRTPRDFIKFYIEEKTSNGCKKRNLKR